MLWGRSPWMPSGILGPAFNIPFQLAGCGGSQRRSCTGGLARGTRSRALTPEGKIFPASDPPVVWIGLTGVSTVCESSGVAAARARITAASLVRMFVNWSMNCLCFMWFPSPSAYVVIGANGSLGIPTMRLRTYDGPEARSWFKPFRTQVIALDRTDPLASQIEHFAAVIRGEAAPLVTGRDGLQNLRVTEAIAAAARTGMTVEISWCESSNRTAHAGAAAEPVHRDAHR